MKRMEIGEILKNDKIAQGIFAMNIRLPLIAGDCRPGQFVMVYLDNGEMLLPRPVSVSNANTGKGTIDLVYHVVGSGTKQLSRMKARTPSTERIGGFSAGESLRVMGPLGNGFTIKEGLKKVWLVGGGVGTPPLRLLLKELKRREPDIEANVFLGFGFQDTAILTEELEKLGAAVNILIDCNEVGRPRYVVDLLRDEEGLPDEIFACGPKAMLKDLVRYAEEKGIPCQICLEERMACGLGVCVGCVVEATGQEGPRYKKVCCDGPVFYSDAVVFDG